MMMNNLMSRMIFCNLVYDQVCNLVYDQVCNLVYDQVCNLVYDQVCNVMMNCYLMLLVCNLIFFFEELLLECFGFGLGLCL